MAEGQEIPTHFMSCVSALKSFFGEHPDGSTRFLTEVQALTPEDKAEFAELLRAEGYNVT